MQWIYPLEFWKRNLRLTRNQFFNLTNELQLYISPSLLSPNHCAVNTDKKLALTLYYLKDTGSLIITANNFGVAINTASSVIYEVCLAICQNLGPQLFVSLKQERKWGRRSLNLKQSLEWYKLLGVLIVFMYPSSVH